MDRGVCLGAGSLVLLLVLVVLGSNALGLALERTDHDHGLLLAEPTDELIARYKLDAWGDGKWMAKDHLGLIVVGVAADSPNRWVSPGDYTTVARKDPLGLWRERAWCIDAGPAGHPELTFPAGFRRSVSFHAAPDLRLAPFAPAWVTNRVAFWTAILVEVAIISALYFVRRRSSTRRRVLAAWTVGLAAIVGLADYCALSLLAGFGANLS